MTLNQRAYVYIFVLATIICWSPYKPAAYVAPFLVILLFAIGAKNGYFVRRFLLWPAFFGILIVIYAALYENFLVQNALLAFATAGTAAFFVMVPTKCLKGRSPQFQPWLERWCRIVVSVEGLYGILQALYGYTQTGFFGSFNGDYVKGTIDPTFSRDLAFSNPMFAVNMTFLLLFLAPSLVLSRKGVIPFCIGALATVLASVIHVLLMFFVAFALAVLYYRPSVRLRGVAGVVAILVIPYLTYHILDDNLATLEVHYQHLVNIESPRAKIVGRVLFEMPGNYPLMPLIGLGPGQFCSRAALIGTGMYFGTPQDPLALPFIQGKSSDAQRNYLFDLWLEDAKDPYSSSTSHPYFSLLSAYAELGILGLLIPTAVLIRFFILTRRRFPYNEGRIYATAFGSGVLLFFFLAFQENYWEVSQATFLGAMLLKVMWAQIQSSDQPAMQWESNVSKYPAAWEYLGSYA